jgi:hypothetical protein
MKTLAEQLMDPEQTHVEVRVSPEQYNIQLEFLGAIWCNETIAQAPYLLGTLPVGRGTFWAGRPR